MPRTPLLLALAAASGIATGAASAQELPSAQTPSHNIFCLASPPGPGQPAANLRCDIMQKSTPSPRPPANCPLSWGDAFGLDPTGQGYLVCHGDTTRDPTAPVIPYGSQWRPLGLFVCTSQTTGLTCVNSQGHGFSIARAGQRVF